MRELASVRAGLTRLGSQVGVKSCETFLRQALHVCLDEDIWPLIMIMADSFKGIGPAGAMEFFAALGWKILEVEDGLCGRDRAQAGEGVGHARGGRAGGDADAADEGGGSGAGVRAGQGERGR